MKLASDNKIILNPSAEFELLYIALRNHEQRMYTDEEVGCLPEIAGNHIYKKEWETRKLSTKKLIRYLERKGRPLNILEIGCGNGWLSYQLSQIPYSNVTGIDINLQELQQAQRVFAAIPNLVFIHDDINSLELEKFDVIIFASSIQYFHSFSEIIKTALNLLIEEGEIHLIDSCFYSATDVSEAKKRSFTYFHELGFDGMNEFYFHHSLTELEAFNFSILYDPKNRLNKFFKRESPFYWIRIKK